MAPRTSSPRVALAAVAASLVVAGCATEAEAPPAASYLALGDSYTIGESVPAADRWPVRLVDALAGDGIEVEALTIIARTGWITDELLDGIAAAAPEGPFDLVTLQIGVNDQFRGRSLDFFRRGFTDVLDTAIELAGGDPVRVVVLSIPDWGVTPFAAGQDGAAIAAEIDAFNVVVAEETARRKARFVDVTAISRDVAADRSLVAEDGLHPSGSQYAQWVERVLPVVRAVLAKTQG